MVRAPRDRSPIENLAHANALLMTANLPQVREATELIRIARDELIRQKQRDEVLKQPPVKVPTE